MRPRHSACALLLLGLVLALPAAAQDYRRLERVHAGGTSVTGEPITYPTQGPADVRAVVVTLLPGEETGWHGHDVPLFGYILEGEVTVDYGAHGQRTYRAGTGFMEAMATAHNGKNTGTGPCRILAVFLGAEGAKLTTPAAAATP